MGLTSGVDCVGARSACVAGLESQLQTSMLTLIFVFKCVFFRFWSDFGMILDGFGARNFDFLHSFFENVDFTKIVLPLKRNCYVLGCAPHAKSMQNRVREKLAKKRPKKVVSFRFAGRFGCP